MISRFCPRCGKPLDGTKDICTHCRGVFILLSSLVVVISPFLGLVLIWKERRTKFRLLYTIAYGLHLMLLGMGIYLLLRLGISSSNRLQWFGRVPLCNMDPARAPHFGSFVFIFCYRCTFLILGGALSFLFCCCKKPSVNIFLLLFSILFILPCFIDGLMQTFTTYLSTNLLRAGTGCLAGVGIGYLLYSPIKILSWI